LKRGCQLDETAILACREGWHAPCFGVVGL
jgi:hypothetical protein